MSRTLKQNIMWARHALKSSDKNIIKRNTSHIDARDEGGLMWTSRIEVLDDQSV